MKKSAEQYKAFAKKMAEGATIKAAMTSSGWSEKQARKGQKAITKPMLSAMAAEGVKLADIADEVGIETAGKIAIGRLIVNAATGKDGGAMSAKILGSHRSLNLWTPDTQVGLIVLNAPQSVLDNKEAMLADGEPDLETSNGIQGR